MLKERVITGFFLVISLLAVVFLLPTQAVAYVFAAFVLVGAWEWSALSGFTHIVSRLAYAASVLFIMYGIQDWTQKPQMINDLLFLVFIVWLFTFVWLTVTPATKMLANVFNVYLRGLMGYVLLIPTWLSFVAMHQIDSVGPSLVFSLFVLIGLADSGAYFTGKLMGITRLAPEISPGKSVEGVYGGLIISGIGAIIMGIVFDYSGIYLFSYLAVSMLAVVFSIVGDLFESVSKRSAGVKDSGSILPGHGGVLDRIDGYTAAAPVYLFCMSWFPGLLVL